MAATCDVFLVLRPFRHHVSEFHLLMAPLAPLGRDEIASADGFYSEDLDTALLALRLRDDPTVRHILDVRELIARTGLPAIDCEALDLGERERFVAEHLPRYSVYVQLYPHEDEHLPLAERVVRSLAGHLGPRSRTAQPVQFDLDGELPLPAARRRGRRSQPYMPVPRALTSW
jgi:hypothetical protein